MPRTSNARAPDPAAQAHVARRGSVVDRATRVWRGLPSERRLAALAALGLFFSLFLPWYQETVIARGLTDLRSVSASLTGWGAFSFVEAAVLLVAAGVLALLFVRAEGRAFHVPGGDGGVITTAGIWTCVLIIWRMFDKQGTSGHGLYATTSGIEWGIFFALAVAALLTYAGTRIRLAHEPEPPLPGERRDPSRPARVGGLMQRRRDRARASPPTTASGAFGAEGRDPEAGGAKPAPGEPARSPRASRAPEMELDETWTERPPASPSPDASPAPPRRRRPRSIGAPEPSPAIAPPPDPAKAPTPEPEDQRTLGLDRRD